MSCSKSLTEEGQRQLAICNACRYCEGYCAVFPALERRSLFTEGDLGYLANLCHDCRACYQACMYTEPHDFAINIPQLMAETRVATYKRYAKPRFLAALFERGAWAVALLTLLSTALLFVLYELTSTSSLWARTDGPESFYRVVDEKVMAFPALLISLLIVVLYLNVLIAFMRDGARSGRALLSPALWWQASKEAAGLRWLRGGEDDCYYPDLDRSSPTRRINHHILAYGFLITFASTVSAAFMQYVIGELPPYDLLSVPVVLGTVGGIAVTYAAAAFLVMGGRDAKEVTIREGESLNVGFLISLLLVSLTGLALLVSQKAVGVVHAILLLHLATVLAFFILFPYGKMMHAVYRFAAILRHAQESRDEQVALLTVRPSASDE